jgi:DNA-binding NtrC family response regulator
MENYSILVAEPCETSRGAIERALLQQEFQVTPLSPDDLVRGLQTRKADMAIIGPSLAEVHHVRRLGEQLLEAAVQIPVLLLVSNSSEQLAVAALRAGFSEYLRFPCPAVDLAQAVHQCLRRNGRLRQHSPPVFAASGCASMIGESRAMQEVKAYLTRVAQTDSNILITGETGTGKELAAEFVHRNSLRRDKPFVTVNCAAIPDALLESELFGYEKGAFTGAETSRDGKLRAANGGTVFLDEIGDMSSYAQSKILRTIDSKEIQRLGSAGSSVDVRIIAATNQELEILVREEKFRKDLYFRLHVTRIHLPPLRERKEDIPPIVNCYLQPFNRRFGRKVEGLSNETWDCLLSYDWPGNIRELKNVLEALFIHTSSVEISEEELPLHLRKGSAAAGITGNERERLLSALVSANWNKSRAADKLRWSRMTLYRKMAKYHVVGLGN